jgi:hypothetical protein
MSPKKEKKKKKQEAQKVKRKGSLRGVGEEESERSQGA